MITRAVLYARVSGDDGHGRNLSDQLRMCREYALSHDWHIIAELSEDERGVSGAPLNPPQLTKALEMAAAGQYDVLVVREIDRLSRDIGKQYIVENELKLYGVQIVYVLDEYSDTPENELNKAMKVALASHEQTKIIERMVRGRRREVERGSVLVHGHTPYGYDTVYNKQSQCYQLVINEEQAKVVRLIYGWYTTGDGSSSALSVRAITLRLNAEGVQAPRSGRWSYATIRRILMSETYVGKWYYGKWKANHVANDPSYFISVDVPAIVNDEIWNAAQEHRSLNQKPVKREKKRNYLLAGRLRCGICNHGMCGKVGGSNMKGTYSCYHAYDPGRGVPCSHKHPYSQILIECLVWGWIRSILIDLENTWGKWEQYEQAVLKETTSIRTALEIAESGISKHQKQLERLLDLYLAGELDRDIFIERKISLENIIVSLRDKHDQLAKSLANEIITVDQLQLLKQFVLTFEGNGDEIRTATNFTQQRHIIELLDVRGIITLENGERVIHLSCRLSNEQTFYLTNL